MMGNREITLYRKDLIALHYGLNATQLVGGIRTIRNTVPEAVEVVQFVVRLIDADVMMM
jgi:hypothetical protein